jgi:hypothetical protein
MVCALPRHDAALRHITATSVADVPQLRHRAVAASNLSKPSLWQANQPWLTTRLCESELISDASQSKLPDKAQRRPKQRCLAGTGRREAFSVVTDHSRSGVNRRID